MKRFFCLLAVVAVSVSAMAETSPVYFRGILNLGNAQQFSLTTDGGAESAWVAVGDSFNGYEIVAFDSRENVLVLRKEGEDTRLALLGARIAPEEVGPPLEEAAELLRSMKFEEMLSISMEQQKAMMSDMFRQMAEHAGAEANQEMIAQQMRFMEAFQEELDWGGMQEDMIQAYSETFTRDELKGLIDFYSTPAGRGFVEKQGDLMQRTTELMQPRIIGAITKLQPLIEEMQQRAREEDLGAEAARLP